MGKVYSYIKSDVYRYYGSCSIFNCLHAFLHNRTLRFQIILRMRQGNNFTKVCGKFFSLIFKNRNLDISIETKIGYGLYIGHDGPVVINPTAIIGNNVNLSQFLTIGSNEGKAAIIGNNVYIGPNVCIVEDVIIGDNVTIGAGSVVTKNIENNATVAGNYAKVLNYNNPGRYIKNKWIFTENGDSL